MFMAVPLTIAKLWISLDILHLMNG
jgi:hypothetical protein